MRSLLRLRITTNVLRIRIYCITIQLFNNDDDDDGVDDNSDDVNSD